MKLGTSSAVVAAFVGPGTVLTCAAAGVRFGYSLGWVLVFSTASVFILQSLTAGTGILAGVGLGEAIRLQIKERISKIVVYSLVVLGLWIGCAAFEMGNLVGAASGLASIFGGELQLSWIVAGMGVAAGLLLLLNATALIRVFTGLVALMSLLFLAAFMLTPKALGPVIRGLLIPEIPPDGIVTVIALIGTTVVTYNLFLHPTLCKRYWRTEPDRKSAWRRELTGMGLFLPIGGLISFSILGTGAALQSAGNEVSGIGDFSALLEPAAGPAARYLFGLGLFGAGITSAMTAPLAAASGIAEIFNWSIDHRNPKFRLIWFSVLLSGMFFGLSGISPLTLIIAAQAANGLLLPLVAGFMLYIAVRQPMLRNKRWYLLFGLLVTVLCAGLGVRTLAWVWTRLV